MRKILFILLAITVFSCKKEKEVTTTAGTAAPVANFTFSGDNKPAPCEVTFTNASTNATTYLWEFGDGATSTLQNPKHSYTTGGSFPAKLTSTGQGGTNSITKILVVQNPVAGTPVANFSFTGDYKPAPCEVSFTNSSTNATSYSWAFGDGATSTEQNPKHTYTTGGTFTAKLTSTGQGGTNSITKNVVIQNPVAAPVANFTYTGANNFAPSNIPFTNTSTNAVSYSWDFGDGQSSTLQNPSHVFATGGTYNVTLTAKNSINTQNVINKTITVKNAPTKLKINSIILTAMPFISANGSGWDNLNGPDLFFKITDIDNTNYFSTGISSNTLQSDLPNIFSNYFPYTIDKFDFEYRIQLWDQDSPDADDFIGGYYFTVRYFMPINGSQYPSTINFESATSQIKFTLNVEWVE